MENNIPTRNQLIEDIADNVRKLRDHQNKVSQFLSSGETSALNSIMSSLREIYEDWESSEYGEDYGDDWHSSDWYDSGC